MRSLFSNMQMTESLTFKHRNDPRVAMMQNMFMARPMQSPPITHSPTPESQQEEEATQITSEDQFHSFAEQVTFNSDLSSDDEPINDNAQPPGSEVNMGVQNKRRRLDVPYRDQRKRKQEATAKE